MSTEPLYHICTWDDWQAAVVAGCLSPSPGLESPASAPAILHCSTAPHVEETANRFFAGCQDLMLLTIDPGALESTLVWEPAPDRGGVSFPHVHGVVPLSAVLAATRLFPDRDGRFRLFEQRDGTLAL